MRAAVATLVETRRYRSYCPLHFLTELNRAQHRLLGAMAPSIAPPWAAGKNGAIPKGYCTLRNITDAFFVESSRVVWC